jgi:hypothetical protein
MMEDTLEKRRQHYLKLAEEAETQAARHTGYVRDSYLRLATGWRELAAHLLRPRGF